MKYIFIIFLIMISYSSLDAVPSKNNNIFRDDQKNIVKIVNTIWQDSSEIATNKLNWTDSNKYCQDLDLVGFTNWHLPTIKMLMNISQDDSKFKTFKNIKKYSFWAIDKASSSSTVSTLNFDDGLEHLHNIKEKHNVLCVTSDPTNTLINPEYRNITTLDTRYGYVVIAEQLNIRDKPMIKSNIIGTYNMGEYLKVISQNSKWVQTEKGWVSSRFLIRSLNYMNLIESITTLLITYAIVIFILIVVYYFFDITGLIITSVLLNLIGYFFLNFEYSLITTSLIYIMALAIILIQIFLTFFRREFPKNIQKINPVDIELSKEDLEILHNASMQLDKLINTKEYIESLDITRKQDGTFSERSSAGKKANSDLLSIESEIRNIKVTIRDAEFTQREYMSIWETTNTIRSIKNSMIVSIIISILCILSFNFYLTSDFFTPINVIQYNGLVSIVLFPFIFWIITEYFDGAWYKLYSKVADLNKESMNKIL